MTDTDFETMYVAWCEHHMSEERDGPLPPLPPDPEDVRAWWHENHRPPLAERIAEAVMREIGGRRLLNDVDEDILPDIQRGIALSAQVVLDDEGERA